MAKAVIAYDKDLPEIPGRCPWEQPVSFLVKDAAAPNGWRIDDSGRRASRLLLIKNLRKAVDKWRKEGYPGASGVTLRLFQFWFEEDHEIGGSPSPFRYHFCQREAMEILVYLVEVVGERDAKGLVDTFAEVFQKDLLSKNIEYQTTMDGRRQIRRYVPELDAEGVQDLPPENLRRYAFKMATGSGKTVVMAMAIVWAHFHKKRVLGSDLSTNFLIVAPNIIVYQRLEKDFKSNQIFHELPLIPPEWKASWSQNVILRGDGVEPAPSGNLFLTNIQQLYEARDLDWTPQNAIDALLGQPVKDLASHRRSVLERIKELKDLVVINDEAHHVHDEGLAWSQSLLGIHRALPKGLALWLDFSATPKDQNGMYFPWTVCDYPLAQAVEDRIVKAPIIVTKEDDKKQPAEDPDNITKDNVCEKFGYWIQAAVQRWKEHDKTYRKLATKPVLFIMAEKNVLADAIGKYLWQTKELGFKESEVKVIHTDTAGEITKTDLEEARQVVRDIDKSENKIKVIVSVMMLREGWDVRNVSVVLGLRPFTARAEILPEQVIGRGLRLMVGIGADRTQTLEVLGTRNLLKVLREQLEAEGVGIASTRSDPPKPVIIEAVLERSKYDIAIPITKPRLTHNVRKLSSLDPSSFDAIYNQNDVDEVLRISLRMEFATTETEVHQDDLLAGTVPITSDLLSSITNKVLKGAKLTGVFSQVLPIVRTYVQTRCFGKPVDVNEEKVRAHLHRLTLQEGIAKYLARKISELTVEKGAIEFENAEFKLSETKPFSWKRNLPPLELKNTVFNYVATYNDFERRFAEFLNDAKDVLRFASLATTEQGDSNTQFKIDYLKPSGAIGFYHPDWVVVQKTDDGEVNWIIETKGRIFDSAMEAAKLAAMDDWCARVSEQTGKAWKHARVNQIDFHDGKPHRPKSTLEAILAMGLAVGTASATPTPTSATQPAAVVGQHGHASFPAVGTEEWDRMNLRRAELIRKRIHSTLTPEEQSEYERLQRHSQIALEKAYPSPTTFDDRLEQIEARLRGSQEGKPQ